MSPTTASAIAAVGSVPARLRPLVEGAQRTARVVHTGPDAIYADLDGLCLGVLSARAVQVPCGVRTLLPTLPAVALGDKLVVGDGFVSAGRLRVDAGPITDTELPPLSAPGASWAAANFGATVAALDSEGVTEARRLLPGRALTALAAGDPGAVVGLLGLGPGLTPLGDDVLAGWLSAAYATADPAFAPVAAAVRVHARARTTTLSATLLECAADGDAVPEFHALISALEQRDTGAASAAVTRLLALGSTSGAGIVLGACLAFSTTHDNCLHPETPSSTHSQGGTLR